MLVAGVEQARAYHVDVFVDGFAHLVRTLVELGRREEAESYRDLTRDGQSPYAVGGRARRRRHGRGGPRRRSGAAA